MYPVSKTTAPYPLNQPSPLQFPHTTKQPQHSQLIHNNTTMQPTPPQQLVLPLLLRPPFASSNALRPTQTPRRRLNHKPPRNKFSPPYVHATHPAQIPTMADYGDSLVAYPLDVPVLALSATRSVSLLHPMLHVDSPAVFALTELTLLDHRFLQAKLTSIANILNFTAR
ncbi:hypothetical protein PtA15_2A307 [Puccinia triticina]|uniref:Uncharacterized protein n=1 Tax=Puccinia triticina TaxID=208348 RepID=A0ABY7CAC6_9BASI|nr:uncharacterized protein PtA15_2A307 [Puccinia triticina]WAQ81994.1 hypothetical protein PtA15_2A307 [Puccinia triticina]